MEPEPLTYDKLHDNLRQFLAQVNKCNADPDARVHLQPIINMITTLYGATIPVRLRTRAAILAYSAPDMIDDIVPAVLLRVAPPAAEYESR